MLAVLRHDQYRLQPSRTSSTNSANVVAVVTLSTAFGASRDGRRRRSPAVPPPRRGRARDRSRPGCDIRSSAARGAGRGARAGSGGASRCAFRRRRWRVPPTDGWRPPTSRQRAARRGAPPALPDREQPGRRRAGEPGEGFGRGRLWMPDGSSRSVGTVDSNEIGALDAGAPAQVEAGAHRRDPQRHQRRQLQPIRDLRGFGSKTCGPSPADATSPSRSIAHSVRSSRSTREPTNGICIR